MILDRCWEYPGARNRKGYGTVGLYGTSLLHHRYVYEAVYGPIPEGLEIDHLCENTSCFNPTHLEAVTGVENMRRRAERKTHCKNGHEWVLENQYERNGRLWCLPCRRNRGREAQRRLRARKKEQSLAVGS